MKASSIRTSPLAPRRLLGAVCAALVTLLALVVVTPAVVVESQTLQYGTGWSEAYWNGSDFVGAPLVSRTIPGGVNFNFQHGSPDPQINPDNFVGRYASAQIFNQGTYEFIVTYDDGIRVLIDNVVVFDQFNGPPAVERRFQQTLTAGTHQLQVQYKEIVDTAQVMFAWQQITGVPTTGPGVGGFATVTPFGTPPGTPGTEVPSGPQAVVTGVRGLALRSGPYLGASFITTLTPGNSYTVLGRNRDEGIYNWYFLQVGTRQGWASGRYLTINVTDVNQIPVVGTSFDNIDGAPDIGARAIPRAVMNVRRRPSPRVERVGSIPWGGVAELIGRTVQGGMNRWLHVRYTDENGNTIVGWIDSRWVTVQGELYNVPIR